MTAKEIAALDKKIEALKPKLIKAKESYDDLADQMSALLDQRYPERKEEAIKNRLYEAYSKNGKSVDLRMHLMTMITGHKTVACIGGF